MKLAAGLLAPGRPQARGSPSGAVSGPEVDDGTTSLAVPVNLTHASSQPVTVDADHMESFQKEGLVIFTGSVVARQNGSVQYADRMEVYLDERGERVIRTVSTGNVRIITRDCRTGTARRAEYYDGEQRVELLGDARVWREDNVVTGEQITIFVNQDRSVVQGGKQERVKAIFYPKEENQAAIPVARKQPECTN